MPPDKTSIGKKRYPVKDLSANPHPPLDCSLPIVYDITKHLTEGGGAWILTA